jgi:hypothetical protein
LERRTGWVSRLFGRKIAAAKIEIAEAEVPEATQLRKTTGTVAVKTKTAAPVPAVQAGPKPTPEKPDGTVSAIDALRKARERAQRRTDKDR